MLNIDSEISVERLTAYTLEVAAGIGALLPYLYSEHPGTPVDQGLLETIIHSPTSDELVAFRGAQVVGKATVNLVVTELYTKAHLDNFITHPKVRGQGVGLAIWQELELWAREKGLPKLLLFLIAHKRSNFISGEEQSRGPTLTSICSSGSLKLPMTQARNFHHEVRPSRWNAS